MQTPSAYLSCLSSGIITEEMLSDCLYSVNKRAKNARDKECTYKYTKFSRGYWEKKQEYYEMKEKMLKILEPKCVHVETFVTRCRLFEDEVDFAEFQEGEIVQRGVVFSRNEHREIEYIDIREEDKRYYLVYEVGGRSFHSPIENISKYKELPQVDIGTLHTYGRDVGELISVSFVRKVISVIEEGNYRYEENSK